MTTESQGPAAARASEGLPPPGASDSEAPAAAAAPTPAPTVELEYLAGIEIPEAERSGYENFGAELKVEGVKSGLGNAALAWLAGVRKNGEPQDADASHGFDFSAIRLGPEARPYLDSFGTAMKAAGASQADIDAALRFYARKQVASAQESTVAVRELEAADRQDARRALDWLRSEYGAEAQTNFRLMRDYVKRLPAAERERLEQDRDEDGVHALNNPARLKELLGKARGGSESREEIEGLMQQRDSRYWRGPDSARLQARYRDLLRSGATSAEKPLPDDQADIDKELAGLRAKMGHPKAWAKDEAGQRRYRALLDKRGAER